MSDAIAETAGAADAAGRQTVRVPANLLRLVRQSYDTRDKVLDWILAISVTGALAYMFQDQILAAFQLGASGEDPNTGRAPEPQVNQDVAGAWAPYGGLQPSLYTYAMPVSRAIRYSAGPASTRQPDNPSLPPDYIAPLQEDAP